LAAYTDLLDSITRDVGNAASVVIPDAWMQGRTTYGGLTAALCLEAAIPLAPGMPIRSAQIAFVGPVGGPVTCTPTLLRQGKNTAYVSVRMMGIEGVAAEAILTFGVARESGLRFANLPAPDVTGPDETPSYFGNNPQRPNFTRNFNMRMAAGERPVSGSDTADVSIWMRHVDPAAPTDAVALLAIADAPPPAVMSMFTQPARISSMTWMAEFLTDDITTTDGWFLSRHIANTARDGYSSQAMTLWNSAGEPMMIGRQTIAVFG
jgi:acyl-CoA thioesterase